jgi:hypothetical protein
MKKTIKQIVPLLLLLTMVAVSGCKKEAQMSNTTWHINGPWASGGTNFDGILTFRPDKTLYNVTTFKTVSSSNWSVSGYSVTFSGYATTNTGLSTILTFRGTVSGKAMSGTMSNSYGDTGTFTATEQ